MKTKIFNLFMAFFLLTTMSQAQDYKTSIGGKVGYGLVASYKTFMNDTKALDIYGGIHWAGSLMGGVNYSIHKDIQSVDGLRWYYGFGGNFFNYGGVLGAVNWFEVGVSGNIGLEYTFKDIPLNISVDYVPTIVIYENDDFNRFSRFRGDYGALTARYILNR
jgi:hypothetical protein